MLKKKKILNIVYLAIIIIILIIMSLTIEESKIKIEIVELDGNNYLSKEQYLSFANLIDTKNYENITLTIIRDRIRKHPYVENVNVKHEENNKATITIKEKETYSILTTDNSQFLLSNKFEVLPILPGTKDLDYPVISNPRVDNKIREFDLLDGNDEFITASKIIQTLKLSNVELYENLSEIDLRKGGDIIIYFSIINYPVVIGRQNEEYKTFYFNELWNALKQNEINEIINYIDLRYNKFIYLGIENIFSEDKENQI
ncbi:MAG: FtsQ-type POTRA domain-containing protein [Ignavibacteriales bacterium]|nr:FtsQ-type POTRA domain-containing protein [Ignavibacteriales bacterium]